MELAISEMKLYRENTKLRDAIERGATVVIPKWLAAKRLVTRSEEAWRFAGGNRDGFIAHVVDLVSCSS